MKTIRRGFGLGLALALFGLALVLAAQQNRSVEGMVVDANDNPLPGAIVYLSSSTSRGVRTYIVGDDGRYAFHALPPNTDLSLQAVYHKAKSPTRTVSQFDTRATIHIDLKVPIGR